ncbi:MAG: CoA-disulfide reductase, partial [Enterococcus faecium]|nr:CoA-disulfide reductase [Enterococcus faecium]
MKVVVIGGVAGGPSFATRFRRLNEAHEIIIYERGVNISYASCALPYYLGGVI